MGNSIVADLYYIENKGSHQLPMRGHNFSGTGRLLLAGDQSVSEDYMTARCYRCGSTMRLLSTGLRSRVYFCQICLEGEIRYKNPESGIRPTHDFVAEVPEMGQYVAVPMRLSVN